METLYYTLVIHRSFIKFVLSSYGFSLDEGPSIRTAVEYAPFLHIGQCEPE